MSLLKEKEEIISALIKEKLNSIGFLEVEKSVYKKKLDEFSTGVIMIAESDRWSKHTWFISPIIGIVNSRVEELYVNMVDSANDPTKLLSAMCSIGYLLPENKSKSWEFPDSFNQEQIQDGVNDIMTTIQMHILPLFENSLNLSTFLKLLEEGKMGQKGAHDYRIPIIYYLLGEKEKGFRYIEEVLARVRPSPKDPTQEIPTTFSSLEEISPYFRRDRDVKYYYHYLNFAGKYRDL